MPPTLGQRLKHAREKRGLTLRDLEHTTRIPVARLQDLEDDKLNTFGGMAYAKSFLRAYSTLLDVNAEEILGQMNPPPLGGIRDYRYLVESHGPWIIDRYERHVASYSPHPGKSFMFAAMISVVAALVIGGAVLASGYFHSKNTPVVIENHAATVPSPSSVAFVPDENPDKEWILKAVTVTGEVDKAGPAGPEAAPPKAVPVKESANSKATAPPKAVLVR